MAMFNITYEEKFIDFDKNKIIEDIKAILSSDYQEWNIIYINEVKSDLTLIRKIDIQEEISITSNPFNHYKKIITSTYHLLIAIIVDSIDKEIKEEIIEQNSKLVTTTIVVDSVKEFFRFLKKYK